MHDTFLLYLAVGHGIFESSEQRPTGEVCTSLCRRGVHEPRQNSKCLAVPFEAAMFAHAEIERDLASMTEWRMADVVDGADRFHERAGWKKRLDRFAGGGAQLLDDPQGDLANLNGMGQPVAVKITISDAQYLGYARKPAKRFRVDHP